MTGDRSFNMQDNTHTLGQNANPENKDWVFKKKNQK